jgi:hypothetical protein
MFNDEIDLVRISALNSVQKMGPSLQLNEEQVIHISTLQHGLTQS